MQLIYIHGLDSGSRTVKGQWLEDYCAQHHAHVCVLKPDLNMPPLAVMEKLSQLIAQDAQTVLVGSSLGGFFATACVAKHGVPAVLLNPSVRPFDSLQRFDAYTENTKNMQEVVHTTKGGWQITRQHFADLKTLYHDVPVNADKMLVLLKAGDEVLDYRIAKSHYSQAGAVSQIIIDEGGDHQMTDFKEKLPLVMQFFGGLISSF